jgi:hypothetical protein
MAMKISYKDELRLQIIQPDKAHIAQTVIFFAIGFFGTISVITSGEGLANGIFFYLLLIASFIWFRYGGKPDMATFDKKDNTLELVEFPGTFSKPKVSRFRITDIRSCELDGTHFVFPAFGTSNRKAFAILLYMNDGKKVYILPYTNGRKRCEKIYGEVRSFIGL